MNLNHRFGDIGREWNFENYLFVSVGPEAILKWFLYLSIYFFFSFSHQMEKCIIHLALKGEKRKSRKSNFRSYLNIDLKKWAVPCLCHKAPGWAQTVAVVGVFFREAWHQTQGVLQNFLVFLGAVQPMGAVLPRWNVMLHFNECFAGHLLPHLVLMHCFLNVYSLTWGWVKL